MIYARMNATIMNEYGVNDVKKKNTQTKITEIIIL